MWFFYSGRSTHPPGMVNLTCVATAKADLQHSQWYLRKVCVPEGSQGCIYCYQQAKLHISSHNTETSLVVNLHFSIALTHSPSATHRSLGNLNELCNPRFISTPGRASYSTLSPTQLSLWSFTPTTVQSENIQLILQGRAKNNPPFYFLITVNISSSAAL